MILKYKRMILPVQYNSNIEKLSSMYYFEKY